jgi:hypothetical protein
VFNGSTNSKIGHHKALHYTALYPQLFYLNMKTKKEKKGMFWKYYGPKLLDKIKKGPL